MAWLSGAGRRRACSAGGPLQQRVMHSHRWAARVVSLPRSGVPWNAGRQLAKFSSLPTGLDDGLRPAFGPFNLQCGAGIAFCKHPHSYSPLLLPTQLVPPMHVDGQRGRDFERATVLNEMQYLGCLSTEGSSCCCSKARCCKQGGAAHQHPLCGRGSLLCRPPQGHDGLSHSADNHIAAVARRRCLFDSERPC